MIRDVRCLSLSHFDWFVPVRLDMRWTCAVTQRICPACRAGQMQYVGCHRLGIRESTWTKSGYKTSTGMSTWCHAEHPLMNMITTLIHFAFQGRLCSGEIVVKNIQKIWSYVRQSKSSFYQPRGQSKSSSPVFATQLDTSRVTNSTSCPNLGFQGQCCKRQTRMAAAEGSDWLAVLIQ